MPLSKSRNVRSYIKAKLAEEALAARLTALNEKMRPIRVRQQMAQAKVQGLAGKLNGAQVAEVQRLLAMDRALLKTMMKPCKPAESAST